MSQILIVEDKAVFREPIAAALRFKGFSVIEAGNGGDGLNILHREKADLVLLDISMPGIDGIGFLQRMRAEPRFKSVPVLVLTAVTERDYVHRAAQYGISGYLLKSHFSLAELFERIMKCLGTSTTKTNEPVPQQNASTPQPAPAPAAPAAPPVEPLSREQTLTRIEQITTGKTMPGVVAQLLAMADSARADMKDTVDLLKQDPVIAARVLQVANSAAFASQKARITSLDEAVRNIGMATLRNVALSIGVYQAFPASDDDSLGLVRCWQHSFAVAAIIDRLPVDPDVLNRGTAHVIGLCHDLGDILLRQHFKPQYQVIENLPSNEAWATEARLLSVEHGELVTLVLQRLGLPAAIINPIREYHEALRRGSNIDLSVPARLLRVADHMAHALQLAPSPHALVTPLLTAEARRLGLTDELSGWRSLRGEVLTLATALARLPSSAEARAFKPLVASSGVRIGYVRHGGLASFDPLATALEMFGSLAILPDIAPDTLRDTELDVLVTAAPRASSTPLTREELETARQKSGQSELRIVQLVGGPDQSPALAHSAGHTMAMFPLPLQRLYDLVQGHAAM